MGWLLGYIILLMIFYPIDIPCPRCGSNQSRAESPHEFRAHKQVKLTRSKGDRMTTDKTTPAGMDEYIANFPKDVQVILQKIRTAIRKAAPNAEETIKYQMPTFTLKGNLVHFAAFKNHIGFYPVPTGIEKFKKELSGYVGGKGSVQFPLDQPIPYELISKIVKFRVQEDLEKAEAKGKKKKVLASRNK
jgi:uncharacterized protein YdhG (YjbR/CyaY superfamily)